MRKPAVLVRAIAERFVRRFTATTKPQLGALEQDDPVLRLNLHRTFDAQRPVRVHGNYHFFFFCLAAHLDHPFMQYETAVWLDL